MIYEFRTYDLKPRALPEVEKRFEAALEHRLKYSPLAAFWHTEIGPLNQIVHVWPYESLDDRMEKRAQAMSDPNWPPDILDFIDNMRSEVYIPFPDTPQPLLQPGGIGPVYEMRTYKVKAGRMGEIMRTWKDALPARTQMSPLAFVGYTETGNLNVYSHIWAYKSLEHRAETRAKAIEQGVWPPKGGSPDTLVVQENKILLPATFSPMQ